MVDAPILTLGEVRILAQDGRVERHPRYHAHEKGIAFRRIVTALCRCRRLRKDDRQGPEGRPLHPKGYVAWCDEPLGRHLRVDLDLEADASGRRVLVVTAMEV